MSTFNRTNIIIFQIVWIMLCFLPAYSMDADDAPESVTIDYLRDLYEPVIFDHQTHSDMYDCSACHHHTAGTGTQSEKCKKCHASSGASDDVSCSGCHKQKINASDPAENHATDINSYHIDKPGLKGALHLQCLGCHQSENGPTGCQECHPFTPAGRKRFALKN
jgi:hypothetical protein